MDSVRHAHRQGSMLTCVKKFCVASSAAVTMRDVLRWENVCRLEPLCTMNTVEIISASWSTYTAHKRLLKPLHL